MLLRLLSFGHFAFGIFLPQFLYFGLFFFLFDLSRFVFFLGSLLQLFIQQLHGLSLSRFDSLRGFLLQRVLVV
jgi:hypothetical protein